MKISRLAFCEVPRAAVVLAACALSAVFCAPAAHAQAEGIPVCAADYECGANEYCKKAVGDCDGFGTCTEVPPPICPHVWDPVCGCNNQTYSNSCFAAAAGVNIAYEGECEELSCFNNGDCPGGWFCKTDTGHCGGHGVCEPKPQACILIYDPVCGCDGQTYGNECMAHLKGVSVAHEGTCESVGPCKEDEECPDNFFCQTDPGDCDGEGTCTQYPQICPLILDPVCGCDGKTYGNECMAAMNGVSVAHAGECEPGCCESDAQCPSGHFCGTAPGDCDGEGFCQEIPTVCPLIFDPVCGCDGVTYSNSCHAAMKKVSIAYEGQCRQNVCGANSMCPQGFYCDKRDGDCDGIGRCVQKPWACPLHYDPVCGCDGQTYSNSCFAAGAGVNVAYQGECQDDGCVTDSMCPCGSYCAKNVGDCDGVGKCQEIPEGFCPAVWDPVCGCDGQTYGNACEAAVSGVNIKHTGECGGGVILQSTDSTGFDTQVLLNVLDSLGECAQCEADLTGDGVVDIWDVLVALDVLRNPVTLE